jgi:UDP-N-acetylmuramoylalanine--D-glutamate ligase
VGLGVTNQALVRFLLAQGAKRIAAGDAKTVADLGPAAGWLEALPIDLHLGPGYLRVMDQAEIIFLTPGMRKDLPEIAAARACGAVISSEMGLMLDLCRAKTVAVTASAGKTTTTTLVRDMLARSGHKVFIGGNIGTPLIERALEFRPDELVVLELSSFQLQLVNRSPNVGAVLNLAPNHLDVHRDLAEYVAAKKGIYRYQVPGDWAVFGAGNSDTLKMAAERLAMASGAGGVALFGQGEPPSRLGDGDVSARGWIDGDRLVLTLPQVVGRPVRSPIRLCDVAAVHLRGEHNLLNLLAAALVSVLAGGRLEACAEVATTFETIEHRLEPVGEIDGVQFVNDSIATAPDRTEVALAAFPPPIHLILGGSDKNIPFDGLGEMVVRGGRVAKVVLMGQTAPKIRRAIEEAVGRAGLDGRGDLTLVEAATLEEAVRTAFAGAAPGATVLFSPACASFDMFRNYKARGAAFKEAVARVGEGKT